MKQHIRALKREWAPNDPVIDLPSVKDIPAPLFGDDVWELGCVFMRANKERPVLDFSGMTPVHKQVAKELMACRLNKPTVSTRRMRVVRRYSGSTCQFMLCQLRQAFRFWEDQGVREIGELDQDILNRHVRALNDKHPGQEMTVAGTLQIYVWLYESDDQLSGGGLRFNPWGGRSTTRVAGWKRPDETATPRIPEAVVCALLPWALAFATGFGEDIIAADRDYHGDDARTWDASLPPAEKLDAYLSALAERGRGLPTRDGSKLATTLVASRAGFSSSWLKSNGSLALREATARFGLETVSLRPWSHVPEGCSRPIKNAPGVAEHFRDCADLITAIYIVCAYLSGMRDCEVQDLRRGCVSVLRDELGKPYRWKVRGYRHKERELPELRDWVVVEDVAKAIDALERLTRPYYDATGDDHLFVHHRIFDRGPSLVKGQIRARLQDFASRCSGELAALVVAATPDGNPVSLVPIPDGPNGPWRLTTRQFRKTLAWFFANVPFGVIAGMLQYGHARPAMFEGYAGTSESGFRLEFENEEFLARLGDMTSMYTDSARGIRTVGPMADELIAEFEAISRKIGPIQGEVVSEKRLGQLLRHRAAKMRAGLLAHCFFEPSQARCLEHLSPENRREPVTGLCKLNCPRACVTKDHRAAYLRLAEEAGAWASKNRIGEYGREVYAAERRAALAMVARIEAAGHGQGE